MTPKPEAVMQALPALLQRVCKQEQIGFSPETVLADLAGIDSLRMLQIVALLEEQFYVEIDTIALDNLTTIRDVINAITGARSL